MDPAQYQKKYGLIGIVGYVDKSYVENPKDKKLITGYCFFLSRKIVTWYSRQQQIVSTLTFEAKYIVVSHRTREWVWMQRFLNKLFPDQAVNEKMEMFEDNKISLILMKNPKSQNCTKHINMILHHIWRLVDDERLRIEWIQGSSMLANKLIKVFPIRPFKKHRDEQSLC